MTLVELYRSIVSDLKFHAGSSKITSLLVTFFLRKSFRILFNYRLGRFLYLNRRLSLLQAYLRYRMQARFNCDISYAARLGKNLKFPHPLNIVIGSGSVVYDNVTIWQNVTLGSHGKGDMGKLYPTVKNHVKIFAGSMVIGGVTLNDDSTVGAMSLVLTDVEQGTKVVGVPASKLN